uniref:Odorant binding protein 6 n=1 Tax=Schistocerca gregaria TaxID=7010 RepID=A0A2D1LVV3_SCHGR|nr:odorant binding protein 6 [Schistocerca gregaria]
MKAHTASLATATVVILLLVAAVVRGQDDDMKEMMEQLHQSCLGESGASDANIDEARKGNFIEDGNLKCYMKCIFVQMTCMSDDGVFDADTAIAMLPDNLKDVASKALTACKDEKGSDACDTAFKINQCLFKQAPKDYILV